MTNDRRAQHVYRKRQLPSVTGYKLTKLDEMIDSGEFPPGTPLSDTGRAVGWFEDDIIEWQEKRRAKREGAPSPTAQSSASATARPAPSPTPRSAQSNRQKQSNSAA